MKILGALLELPAKQHCQSSQFTSKLGQIGQIGSAVWLVAPKILIFSITMDADYSFYVKTIETYARTFLALNVSAIGIVPYYVVTLFGFVCHSVCFLFPLDVCHPTWFCLSHTCVCHPSWATCLL